ncbi:O-antigen polymerase [Rubrivirga marina]|uniref:Oligosaccharide repeat unit polymerase n=1 Tax=Rubrivirga marina TaxID=1196024 RepID=A0A271J1H1_9BACT|nr:O-antigen polymerase [Rubrivirga marina]PAP77157.1 hypothetical protein BSZ37_12315 [Rubrivirga marina]
MLPHPPSLRAPSRRRAAARRRDRLTGARRALIGGGLAVVAVAFVLAGASLVLHGSVDYALLGAAGGACLLVLLSVPMLKPDYEIVEPISFVMLATAIGVTLKPAWLAFGPEAARDFLLLNRLEPAFLVNAVALVLFGLLAFAAGYLFQVPAPRLARSRLFATEAWSRWRILLVAAAALTIALVSMSLYLSKLGLTGVIEDFSRKRFYTVEGAEYARSALGYYRWGASVTGPVFLFVLAWALTKRTRLGLVEGAVIVALVLMAVVFPFFNSSRTKVLMVLIQALVIWRCTRGGIPKTVLVGGSVGILALLLILTALRPRQGDLSDAGSVFGAQALLETTVGGRHFMDLTKTAHIIEGVPEQLPYQYGESYAAWAFMPIPRTVWLNKPPLGAGPLIGQNIFNMRYAGVPPGMIAEAYLNFGILGIVLVPFLLGVGMRWVYEAFKPVLHHTAGATLYAVTVIPVGWTTVTGGFSQMMVALMVAAVPLIAIVLFVRVRRRFVPHAV